MKSEWQFQFETRGFRFEREYKYQAKLETPIRLGNREPEDIECFVRIEPSEAKPLPDIEQLGSIYITLPYSHDETRDFAHHIATIVADNITFHQGDFRIRYGLVVCKRIAETPEEEVEFGDKLYQVEAQLEEVVAAPNFESEKITHNPISPARQALVSQFIETKRDTSPIRQFLGFFKIIESIYHSTSGSISLKEALLGNLKLRQIYDSLGTQNSYDTIISELVKARHQCAHLKLGKGFGYAPNNPAVESEIRPLLPLLGTLAHRSITLIER
jgi:hypothetical protein